MSRTEVVSIRLTSEEKARLEERAKEEHRSLAQWVRMRLGVGKPAAEELMAGPKRCSKHKAVNCGRCW